MAYNTPAVNIYQQLENSGGVADVTPDLEACIVGPAYNIISYVAGDTASLIKTAATSTATAVASMLAGSKTLSFTVAPPFTVGDIVLVPGATSTGTTLQATVTGASGLDLTLDTAAVTAVSNVNVTKQGILTNPLVNNTFAIPGQLPGQKIDATSVQVFANNALVETLSTGFNGFPNSNALTYSSATGIGTTSANSAVVASVSNVGQYVVGDTVSIAGAGLAGAALVGKILVINGTNVTLSVSATLAVVAGVMTKVSISNVSPVTSTLLMESGDAVQVNYTDVGGTPRTFTSTVVSVVQATGTITNVTIADVLPTNVTANSTAVGALAAGAVGFTLASASGISTGDTIVIKGAGASGTDLVTVIGNLSGTTVTGLSPAVVTAVGAGAVITKQALVTVKTRKLYNNQSVPLVKPISGGSNYDASATSTSGTFTVLASPEVIYGKLISGTIHVAYKALRTDLGGSIMTITNTDDNLGQFGTVTEDNPLALGVQMALANTSTRVRAIAVDSDDLIGYTSALDLAQSERVYSLVPLSQDVAICQAFAAHAQQMSVPEEALWRAAYVSTKIPTVTPVGSYTSALVNANSGNNAISVAAGKYIFTSSNSTFISDNVTPGDTLVVTAGTGSPSPVGNLQILNVVSNTQLEVQASGIATGISFYVIRTLSKTQRAQAVADVSKGFGSNRVVHVQPDTVVLTIGGRKVALPGYYLACALAGMSAGQPSQQGFTNMAVAGVTDLINSNFTFTRAQLNTMAAAGTLLFVQDSQGSLPYVRHSLTTDMSVYEYREVQAVRNWDFLSYFYYDALKQFIGKWNITPDTINVIRQTVVSGSELLKGKKLPKIGAPLIDYKIVSIAQSTTSKDRLIVKLQTSQPAVLNFTDMYIII